MESNNPEATKSVKWPWTISLALLILGGLSLIPSFILCIYNGAKMNALTWFLVFLPLILLVGGLVFGIVSFAKKKAGSLPLIILSGVLGVTSLSFNALGLFIGGLAGAIESWNDSRSAELRQSVTLEGFLEESEGKTLHCVYLDEEESYSFEDLNGEAKDHLEEGFALTEIEKPYSFSYSAYVYFSQENGESCYLYLGDDYSSVRIYRNYTGFAEAYYSIPESQGKGLYAALKSTYETMQGEISADIETAKGKATYEKFLTEMSGNVANPCYYVSKGDSLIDKNKQALALLEGLNPTLSSQEESQISYDYFTLFGADFVYGIEPYQDVALNCRYAAIKFETGEVHVGYPFQDRYGGKHFICSKYAITADEGAALKASIESIFPNS